MRLDGGVSGADGADSLLRQRLRSGDSLVGGWCMLPTSFAAEIVCTAGVDYAGIDMQHGLSAYSDLLSMLQAIGSAGVAPLVRVPLHDFGLGNAPSMPAPTD